MVLTIFVLSLMVFALISYFLSQVSHHVKTVLLFGSLTLISGIDALTFVSMMGMWR